MKRDASLAVRDLLTLTLGPGGVRYSAGVAAGDWIFGTGLLGRWLHEHESPLPAEPVPLPSEPPERGEARRVFDLMEAILSCGDSELGHVLRLDQYYRAARAVDPYHQERRARFGHYIPASTSMLMRDLVLAEANMDIQFVAARRGSLLAPRGIDHEQLKAPPTSGFSPVVLAGDFVFTAGYIANTPMGQPSRRGLALEACIPEGSLWRGTQIALETRYVIEKQILPALELAESSPEHVVKAQVYLTHPQEVGDFLQVWAAYFGNARPALTIVPSPQPSIGVADARIEINVIALRKDGATRARPIGSAELSPFECAAPAVLAGDLLLLSGQMARRSQRATRGLERFGNAVESEVAELVDTLQSLCEAAGTSLQQVVRLQQFHTDLEHFYPAHRVLSGAVGGRPLPFSAIGCSAPLPYPLATTMLDAWVYAPGGAQ